MASWTKADLKSKKLKLPSEVDSLLSEDTPREQVEILWAALRSCFGSEAEAIAAASRNTGTILPYLNAPSNIYGSYKVLVDMLGRDGAGDERWGVGPARYAYGRVAIAASSLCLLAQ